MGDGKEPTGTLMPDYIYRNLDRERGVGGKIKC